MDKKVILITGGISGIGRAAALAFARQGDTVVVAGRRETEGKALEAELRAIGDDALFIQTDVRRDDEVAALIDQTVARFGRIDAAVNAAGTEGQLGLIVDQTAESYAATFDTNVLGTLPDAQLILYPDANHGSIYQYPELFVAHATLFLDA